MSKRHSLTLQSRLQQRWAKNALERFFSMKEQLSNWLIEYLQARRNDGLGQVRWHRTSEKCYAFLRGLFGYGFELLVVLTEPDGKLAPGAAGGGVVRVGFGDCR